MASKVVPLAAPRDEAEIRAAISSTSRAAVYKALGAGQPFDAAMRNGLVQCSGAVSREVLNGGRDTITEEVQRDPQAQGWARVTGGDPCAFCAMLAGRGPVYKEDTGGFDAHDHCSCDAEPVYEGSEWPGRGREFQRRWYESDGTLNGFRQDLNKTPDLVPGRAAAPLQKSVGKARTFADDAEGKQWLNDSYGGWRKGMTAKEDTGLAFYQSPGYELMNGQLRGTSLSAPATDLKRARDASKSLKSAIAKAPPLEQDTTVFRGFSAGQFDLKAGAIVQDKAFVSTALTKKGVSAVSQYGEQAMATIRLPAGTRAAAGYTRELILAPESKFRIISAVRKGKAWHVEMELLP